MSIDNVSGTSSNTGNVNGSKRAADGGIPNRAERQGQQQPWQGRIPQAAGGPVEEPGPDVAQQNGEFITQLAQFSTVEGVQSLNKSMSILSNYRSSPACKPRRWWGGRSSWRPTSRWWTPRTPSRRPSTCRSPAATYGSTSTTTRAPWSIASTSASRLPAASASCGTARTAAATSCRRAPPQVRGADLDRRQDLRAPDLPAGQRRQRHPGAERRRADAQPRRPGQHRAVQSTDHRPVSRRFRQGAIHEFQHRPERHRRRPPAA